VLSRACPTCGARNPLDAAYCTACGQRLEILDAMLERLTVTRASRLHDLQRAAPRVKEQAEQESQARLEQMWAEERAHRQELQRALLERERQQRLLVIVAVVAAALALAAALIVLALALR
jgi:NMD protein affecting ribosome stability and mRNA decay